MFDTFIIHRQSNHYPEYEFISSRTKEIDGKTITCYLLMRTSDSGKCHYIFGLYEAGTGMFCESWLPYWCEVKPQRIIGFAKQKNSRIESWDIYCYNTQNETVRLSYELDLALDTKLQTGDDTIAIEIEVDQQKDQHTRCHMGPKLIHVPKGTPIKQVFFLISRERPFQEWYGYGLKTTYWVDGQYRYENDLLIEGDRLKVSVYPPIPFSP